MYLSEIIITFYWCSKKASALFPIFACSTTASNNKQCADLALLYNMYN